jgi:hypothetical protein
MSFNNILYIGDEAKTCIAVIEKFTASLVEIEQKYPRWFKGRQATSGSFEHDRLQHHIHYHFEGGIAVFKFKNDDELPAYIKNECFAACRSLAIEPFLAY